MNKPKEQRMNPTAQEGPVRSPANRDRRAVVGSYEESPIMPEEAMLPMPPHNTSRGPGQLMRDTRQLLARWQGLLRLLLRRP